MLPTSPVDHVHDAESSTDDEGTSKQSLDLLRGGVGGHVEVLGTQAQQQVSHGPAHDVGLKALVLQGLHHVQCALIHQLGIDAVFAGRHHTSLAQRGRARLRGLADQALNEFLDHEAVNSSRMGQPR